MHCNITQSSMQKKSLLSTLTSSLSTALSGQSLMHCSLRLKPPSESQKCSFFNEQAVSVAEATALQRAFWAFRSQSPPFESQRDCWRHILDPTTFWAMQAGHARSLGLLAQRISQTPANSVPSERAFSIQNLIHSKQRNRLSPERANKL